MTVPRRDCRGAYAHPDAVQVEAFEAMVRPHGLLEMVRTGEVALSRGE